MEVGMDATNITAPKAQSQPTQPTLTNRQEMLDLLAQKIGVPIEETQQIWCTYQQEMHDRLDQMARAAETHGWKDPDDSSIECNIKCNFYNIMAASRMLDLTEYKSNMSKAHILRSRLPEDLVLRIDRHYLRSHCLATLKLDAHCNYSEVLGELDQKIEFAGRLSHPWFGELSIPWNWEDTPCTEHFVDVCLNQSLYRQSSGV